MPFHIDRFRGSPEVQAMHPAARMGYLYLLSSAWQTEDCTVSSDALDLATESGLGDEMWAVYGARILRNFKLLDGRYRNAVVFEEWEKAKREFEKNHGPKLTPEELSNAKRIAGKKGAIKRWQKHGKPIADCHKSIADQWQKDGLQEQEHIQEQSTKNLTSTALAVPASPTAFVIYLTQGKTHLLTEADVLRTEKAFPAVDVRQELRTMVEWLDAHPEKRSHSPKGAKSRIVNWMSAKQDKGGTRNGNTGSRQRNFTDIADSSREALDLLAGMDTPAYLGGGGAQTGTVVGQVHESAHGPTMAADAQRNR